MQSPATVDRDPSLYSRNQRGIYTVNPICRGYESQKVAMHNDNRKDKRRFSANKSSKYAMHVWRGHLNVDENEYEMLMEQDDVAERFWRVDC